MASDKVFFAFLCLFLSAVPSHADDTAELQRRLDREKTVHLESGRVYELNQALRIPSGGGLIGDGSPVLFLRTGPNRFSNVSQGPDNLVADNANGIRVDSAENVVLKGFKLRKEISDPSYVKGILVTSSRNVLIEGIEATGFSGRNGIITLISVTNSVVRGNFIHSGHTNFPRPGSSKPQITGIEIDDQDLLDYLRVPASEGIQILDNRIENLTVGAEFFREHYFETDGINVGSTRSRSHVIRGNRIKGVGEGIDVFGEGLVIEENHIEETVHAALKLVHGARRNRITQNTILRSGDAAVLLHGSRWGHVFSPVTENEITDNLIADAGGETLLARTLSRSEARHWREVIRGGPAVFWIQGSLPGSGPLWGVLNNDLSRNRIGESPAARHLVRCIDSRGNRLPSSFGGLKSDLRRCSTH